MKKRGFTLIELLAVIVIIGILGGLGIISVRSVIKTGDERYFNALESNVLLAGRDYFTDHRDQLPTGNYYKEVSLNDLVSNKYIEQPKDHQGNACNSGVVYVYRENNKYAYEVCLTCGEYESTGTRCKEINQRNIKMRAWKKGTNTTYTLTTYALAETTKNINVMVEFSMDDSRAVKYTVVNTKTNASKSCDANSNPPYTVEIDESGTYRVTAYDVNNQIITTNQYFNVKIAKTGPQFSIVGINTIEGQQAFMMSEGESVCKTGGNKKQVKFKIVKDNIKEEYKTIEYRVIKDGENESNIEYQPANELEIKLNLESGKYQLEVVVTNRANQSHTETYDFYIGYEMTLEYEDDHSTVKYHVVTGQNYNFVPTETLPTLKEVSAGKNNIVKWHPENESYTPSNEITGSTIVNNSCSYKIIGTVAETVTKPNNLTQAYCNSLTYNGSNQTLTKTIEGITFKKKDKTNPIGQNAGNYDMIAQINLPYYIWADYSVDDLPFTCPIDQAANPISVTASQSWNPTFSTSAQDKTFTAATNAQGAVTYAIHSQKISGGATVSAFSIPTAGTASLRMAANTGAGTYTVVIRATAEGNDNYSSGYKDITMTVTVAKANNPIEVTATQSWSPKFSTSNQNHAFTEATKAQGDVTYAIQSQKNSSGTAVTAFSIPTAATASLRMAASTGVGTYTVVIRASAAGNGNYKPGSKDITMTVTVGKATNPISVTAEQSWSPKYSTDAQDNEFTAATKGQGAVTYAIQSQKNSSGTAVSNFSIPTAATASLRMAASTGVGTYTVVIRASAAGNDNYSSGSKDITMTVTVGKATNSISLTCAAPKYSGSDQNLLSAASATGGSVYVSTSELTSSNYSSTGGTALSSAQGKNAGSYTVYAYTPGNANYAAKAGSKTCSITQVTGTMTLASSKGSVCNRVGNKEIAITTSSSGAITCSTANSGIATCSISGKKLIVYGKQSNGSSDGTTTITVTQAANGNYAATSRTYTVTVGVCWHHRYNASSKDNCVNNCGWDSGSSRCVTDYGSKAKWACTPGSDVGPGSAGQKNGKACWCLY